MKDKRYTVKMDRKQSRRIIDVSIVYFFLILSYEKSILLVYGFNNVNFELKSRGLSNTPMGYVERTRIRALPKEGLNIQSLSSETVAAPRPSPLNPVEVWCTTHMNVWYDKSLSLKCPFIRRRVTDVLDGVDMIMRFLIIRHKSLPLIGPPPGCRSVIATSVKHKNMALEDLVEIIRQDWKPDKQHKGYYITGRLNTTIYRDDCWFDGPDPDMPVRGVRKYLNAASQLFDTSKSSAELLSLDIGEYGPRQHPKTKTTIVARWRLQGVLHLPWHPSLPVWTGRTVYHLDEENMIFRHEEFWDISVLQAFTQTLWPDVGNVLWPSNGSDDESIRRHPS